MSPFSFQNGRGRVHMRPAWTLDEIKEGIEVLLSTFEDVLPSAMDASILLKPNLNNDLVALTGNCTDLRVLAAVIEGLQARGYSRITVADGSNVGVDRRGIDTFARLRVSQLAQRLGVKTLNLNACQGRKASLYAGATPTIAAPVEDCDFLISLPTIKTHVEAGMSCAMKNWVGIVAGQDKRQMHFDLNRNIQAINECVRPNLIIVDGVVGMDGNGPGDGDPVRIGALLAADSAPLCDVVVARMVGLDVQTIPYLGHAIEAGMLDEGDVAAVAKELPVMCPIRPAPPRSALAKLSEDPRLAWLKRAVRPLTDKPAVAEAAYKLGVIQDVYSPDDDGVHGVRRTDDDCGPCRSCAEVCPTGLTVEQVGVVTDMPDCIGCLYCWWVCPDDSIVLDGPLQAMARQAERYKECIEQL